MVNFIKTDRGHYVSMSAIERVEKEVPGREPGRPDNGIRKFSLYGRNDDFLGSVKVLEERMDFLLAKLIPAQPGQKLVTLHFDGETQSVFHLEYAIVAWAFEPGAHSPYPITTEGNVCDNSGIGVLIEMPDGRFDEPEFAVHDSLDAAKADFLKRQIRDAAS